MKFRKKDPEVFGENELPVGWPDQIRGYCPRSGERREDGSKARNRPMDRHVSKSPKHPFLDQLFFRLCDDDLLAALHAGQQPGKVRFRVVNIYRRRGGPPSLSSVIRLT